MTTVPPFVNTIACGDCIDVMASLPAGSVDFILTDPPYLVNYRSRDGRTVSNDDNAAWLKPAFAQMHRVLKPDALCISFYGWNHIDIFMTAWKDAGFSPAGHLVFRKRYASSARFLSYRHEQAFLLTKGRPPPPQHPLDDIREDWRYTGNLLHPTQKPISALQPLIESFTKPGDTVLDPFCGSGSTLVAARQCSRNFIGIELDPTHHATATLRLSACAA